MANGLYIIRNIDKSQIPIVLGKCIKDISRLLQKGEMLPPSLGQKPGLRAGRAALDTPGLWQGLAPARAQLCALTVVLKLTRRL